MNRQISFLLSFVTGLIFMIIPELVISPIKYHLFEDKDFLVFLVSKIMVWLGFLSVLVFGLAILFEGIRNIIR